MARNRKSGDANRKPLPKNTSELKNESTPTAREEETEPAATEYTELVLLVHASNIAEGELIKTELESNGIPAILEGEGSGVAGIPDVGTGVPILVPEEYADQAAELIAELESTKPEGNTLVEKDDFFEEDEDAEELEEVDEVEENVKDEDLDDEDEDLDDDEDDDLDDEDEEEADEDDEDLEEDDEDEEEDDEDDEEDDDDDY